ncbi:MAG: hypothetical protein H0T53_04405 [Herpetosiphonaceae bacterium]|nr:hypothetical protein [Herpetosiphonaceae bacterium]
MPFQISRFIEHSPATYTTLLTTLDQAIIRRDVLPLAGIQGAGKTWMLQKWFANSSHARHLIFMRMPKSNLHKEKASADRGTLMCFARIDHHMQERFITASHGVEESFVESASTHAWTKNQFYQFYHQLLRRIKQHHIWAIIIDQANNLSHDAWEELMELRADCDGALAIIPCLTHIRATTASAAWEPWAKRLHARENPHPVVEIPTMEQTQFLPILLALWAQRGIAVHPPVFGHLEEITDTLWTVILGDWYAIKSLEDRLERSMGMERQITMPLLQGVLQEYHLEYIP